MIHHGGNTWRDRGKPRTYRTDRTCKEKGRYQDEVTVRAAGAVSLAERKNREQLWCYLCVHCNGWHLTSKNQGKRWEITADDPAPHARSHR
jgi:hypothetical protein